MDIISQATATQCRDKYDNKKDQIIVWCLHLFGLLVPGFVHNWYQHVLGLGAIANGVRVTINSWRQINLHDLFKAKLEQFADTSFALGYVPNPRAPELMTPLSPHTVSIPINGDMVHVPLIGFQQFGTGKNKYSVLNISKQQEIDESFKDLFRTEILHYIALSAQQRLQHPLHEYQMLRCQFAGIDDNHSQAVSVYLVNPFNRLDNRNESNANRAILVNLRNHYNYLVHHPIVENNFVDGVASNANFYIVSSKGVHKYCEIGRGGDRVSAAVNELAGHLQQYNIFLDALDWAQLLSYFVNLSFKSNINITKKSTIAQLLTWMATEGIRQRSNGKFIFFQPQRIESNISLLISSLFSMIHPTLKDEICNGLGYGALSNPSPSAIGFWNPITKNILAGSQNEHYIGASPDMTSPYFCLGYVIGVHYPREPTMTLQIKKENLLLLKPEPLPYALLSRISASENDCTAHLYIDDIYHDFDCGRLTLQARQRNNGETEEQKKERKQRASDNNNKLVEALVKFWPGDVSDHFNLIKDFHAPVKTIVQSLEFESVRNLITTSLTADRTSSLNAQKTLKKMYVLLNNKEIKQAVSQSLATNKHISDELDQWDPQEYMDQGERESRLQVSTIRGVPGLSGRGFDAAVNLAKQEVWQDRHSAGKSHNNQRRMARPINKSYQSDGAAVAKENDDDEDDHHHGDNYNRNGNDDDDEEEAARAFNMPAFTAQSKTYSSFDEYWEYESFRVRDFEHQAFVPQTKTNLNNLPKVYSLTALVGSIKSTGNAIPVICNCGPGTNKKILVPLDLIAKKTNELKPVDFSYDISVNGTIHSQKVKAADVYYNFVVYGGDTIVGALLLPCPTSLSHKDLSFFNIRQIVSNDYRYGKFKEAAWVSANDSWACNTFPTNNPRLISHNVSTNDGDCGAAIYEGNSVRAIHVGKMNCGNYSLFIAFSPSHDGWLSLSPKETAENELKHQSIFSTMSIEDFDRIRAAEEAHNAHAPAVTEAKKRFEPPFSFVNIPQSRDVTQILSHAATGGGLLNAPGATNAFLSEENDSNNKIEISEADISKVRNTASALFGKTVSGLEKNNYKRLDYKRLKVSHFNLFFLWASLKGAKTTSSNFLNPTYKVRIHPENNKKTFFIELLKPENEKILEKYLKHGHDIYHHAGTHYSARAPVMVFLKNEAMKEKKLLQGRSRTIKEPLYHISVIMYMFSVFIYDIDNFVKQLEETDFRDEQSLEKVMNWDVADIDAVLFNHGPSSETPQYSCGVGSDLFTLCKKLSNVRGKFINVDVSGWDKNLPYPLMQIIYRQFINVHPRVADSLCSWCNYNTALVYNGKVFNNTSPSWASGNRFTLSGNSFIHHCMIEAFFPGCAFLTQGDDAVIRIDSHSLNAVATFYKAFGFELKTSEITENGFEFCKIHVSNGRIIFDIESAVTKGLLNKGVDLSAVVELASKVDGFTEISPGCLEDARRLVNLAEQVQSKELTLTKKTSFGTPVFEIEWFELFENPKSAGKVNKE